MGKVVLHMQKMKASALGGIQSHVQREHPPKTNPDIDPSRTKDNYILALTGNYREIVKNKIREFAPNTKTVRKDAVVLCNFIVTSDEQTMKAMTLDEQRDFFQTSLLWLCDRYGRDNLAFAVVHMDEKTPHMHLGIVPIKEQRLSAKAIFDKKELTSLQTDFAAEVGNKFGLERGQEGSQAQHLSELRFKIATAQQELENLQEQINTLETDKNRLKDDLKPLQGQVAQLQVYLSEKKETLASKLMGTQYKLDKQILRTKRALELVPAQAKNDFKKAMEQVSTEEFFKQLYLHGDDKGDELER